MHTEVPVMLLAAVLTGLSLVTWGLFGLWSAIVRVGPSLSALVRYVRPSVCSPVVRIRGVRVSGCRYDLFCGLIQRLEHILPDTRSFWQKYPRSGMT